MRNCESCGEEIPALRLKYVPDAERCLDCQLAWEKANPDERIVGTMVYEHKTGGHCVPMKRSLRKEMIRLDRRGYKKTK